MDDFLVKLKGKCEVIAKKMGRPDTPECLMGPLISSNQLKNVIAIVDEAVSQGVSVLCGGARMTGKSQLDDQDFGSGYYYPPTVLIDGPKAKLTDSRIWKDEAFGPVIVVIGFSNEEEAISLANDSEFGLGAALWTTDLSQAYRVADRIEAGITWGEQVLI
jgi:acyl-CoA reductase-like NAD-dependent aldehyde dehydrogenase